MATPDEDFETYMDSLQRQQASARQHEEMLQRHQVWRTTTWSGWVVVQLQAVGNHLAPFVQAVLDAADSNSTLGYLLVILIRLLQVCVLVLFLYGVARVLNIVLDREIIIEEEIVVEEEEMEDEIKEPPKPTTRRSARDKKER